MQLSSARAEPTVFRARGLGEALCPHIFWGVRLKTHLWQRPELSALYENQFGCRRKTFFHSLCAVCVFGENVLVNHAKCATIWNGTASFYGFAQVSMSELVNWMALCRLRLVLVRLLPPFVFRWCVQWRRFPVHIRIWSHTRWHLVSSKYAVGGAVQMYTECTMYIATCMLVVGCRTMWNDKWIIIYSKRMLYVYTMFIFCKHHQMHWEICESCLKNNKT